MSPKTKCYLAIAIAATNINLAIWLCFYILDGNGDKWFTFPVIVSCVSYIIINFGVFAASFDKLHDLKFISTPKVTSITSLP